jgi:RNA polymerase sigma-70 factor (ECF subfamily)
MENSIGSGSVANRQKESSQPNELSLGNKELMAEEATLTSEQKLEKIYSFQKKSIILATHILSERNYGNIAEDIVSDAYVKAAENIEKFRHEATLESWFYKIVVRQTLIYLRKQNSIKEKHTVQMPILTSSKTGDEFEFPIPDSRPNSEQILITKEEEKLLTLALDRLPPIYRAAITLTKIEGLSDEKAAEATGISLETHRSRKFRGKEKLKKIMNPIGGVRHIIPGKDNYPTS